MPTILIDDNIEVSRTIRNGVITYKNKSYGVFEHDGQYRVDTRRPASPLDEFDDQEVLAHACQIVEARARLEPSLFFESPDAVKSYYQMKLYGFNRERFMMAFLDNRHRLLDDVELHTEGTLDSSSVFVRHLLEEAFKRKTCNAAIALHQHPSGVCAPSRADVDITARIKKVFSLVNIRLLDHLIITNKEVYSLAEHGEL